ncbi:hypothetical protein, partial [Rosenbergiella epipactidis]|uniref:hypothetical protein n=1 Tax=Rosenbergiella epipactidis TaxID=1544694 RepID=UPI001F4F06CC
KIFFLDRGDKAYNFPHRDGSLQLITAIKPFLSVFLMGFLLCLLLGLFSNQHYAPYHLNVMWH